MLWYPGFYTQRYRKEHHMYKASMELGRIHKSMRLRFSVIIRDDDISNGSPWNREPLYKRFRFQENEYFKVNPHPFLTIDISDRREMKKEGWNSGYSVSLNQKALFLMRRRVRELIQAFQTEHQMFYYNERNELVVNPILADKHKIYVPTSQKTILMQPCVVPDDETPNKVYEGVFFAINRMEYYTYLTFEELDYFYEILSSIRMTELAMHLLTLDLLTKEEPDAESSGTTNTSGDAWNLVDDRPIQGAPFVIPEKPSTIPEI